MYTVRTLSGDTLWEMLNPSFRNIAFDDDPAVLILSSQLRQAWSFVPDAAYTMDRQGIEKFMKANSLMTEEQRTALPKADDRDVQTEWRKAVLTFWAHIYADVMRFLPEAAMSVGHYHPPAHSYLAVDFPRGGAEKTVKTVSWDAHVLLIPTYLAEGFTLRVTKAEENPAVKKEEELGTFDKNKKAEIWWLRENTTIHIYVEGDWKDDKNRGTVAAVLAIGELCDNSESDAEKDEEGSWEDESETDGSAHSREFEIPSELAVMMLAAGDMAAKSNG